MAKAIASGDHRLMQQAGLTADIARLERLEAAHKDEQWVIRREIEWARGVIERADRRIPRLQADIAKRITPTAPTLLDGCHRAGIRNHGGLGPFRRAQGGQRSTHGRDPALVAQ